MRARRISATRSSAARRRKKIGANKSILAFPFPRNVSLRHHRSSTDPTVLPLSRSVAPPVPPLAPPSVLVALSRFLSLDARFLPRAQALPPPSCSLPERTVGFRRKETTIRRIVATDHSWRVDRDLRRARLAAGNDIRRVRCEHSRAPVFFHRHGNRSATVYTC